MVGFPTSGWVSNQWLEFHPWWVSFQPFTLVGLGAVVDDDDDDGDEDSHWMVIGGLREGGAGSVGLHLLA